MMGLYADKTKFLPLGYGAVMLSVTGVPGGSHTLVKTS